MQAGTGTVTDDQIRASYTRTRSKKRVAKELHISERRVRKVIGAAATGDPCSTETTSLRGFTVNATTRVSAKRPQATIRARFYTLKRGMCYLVADVAKDWCISPDTLRKHANDCECFRYVEISGTERWEPCVMHPDTAKQYPIK